VNQPEAGRPDSWAFFDKIYCITLETRPDRREQARKQFADTGLLHRIEFVSVAKHPVNPEEGIFQSHMICLNKGLKEKARRILIFEDDVFFQGIDVQALHEACNYLDSATKWNALFLGCITDGSKKTPIRKLTKITYRCLAHAYALNRPFAKHIVQQTWSGIPFDELLRRHNSEFYALYPMCAFQGLAGTDNQTVVIDRMRRIFGGLPFIQKANELYQNHKMVLLALMAVLLVLVFLTLRLW
jgi:GR25 family glycosyltransferase involved in LPS biosynthesis